MVTLARPQDPAAYGPARAAPPRPLSDTAAVRQANRWTRVVLCLALPAYAVFIARSSFEFRGERYFVLLDDAMISMRYGRNLADGDGLVWNPGGEAVEGYSNLLWTLLMAVVHLLPLPESKASLAIMVVSAAILAATVWTIRGIALELWPDGPGIAVGAAALTAFAYPLAFWSLRGMEVGLVALLVASAVLAALRIEREPTGRHLAWLAAVVALGVLTRDDVAVPMVVVIAYAVARAGPEQRRRVAAVLVGALVVTLAAHTAMRLLVYDEALANTYYLKVDGISLGTRLERGSLALLFSLGTSLYAVVLLAAAYLVVERGRWPAGTWLLLALVAALGAYSVYVGGDAWEETRVVNRYVTPALPLLALLASAGAAALVARRRLAVGIGLAAVAVAVPVAAHGWHPAKLGLSEGSLTYENRALAVALLFAGALAAVPLAAGRRAAAVVLVALGLAAFQVVTVSEWSSENAQELPFDRGFAKIGIVLDDATARETPVAAAAVGAVAYFSHRPVVDMLGKMDPAIAHETPHDYFRPGHNKWDFDHSIVRQRPDVVTQLWQPTEDEVCAMRRLGYVEVARQFFSLERAAGVDRAALAAGVGDAGVPPPAGWPAGCAT